MTAWIIIGLVLLVYGGIILLYSNVLVRKYNNEEIRRKRDSCQVARLMAIIGMGAAGVLVFFNYLDFSNTFLNILCILLSTLMLVLASMTVFGIKKPDVDISKSIEEKGVFESNKSRSKFVGVKKYYNRIYSIEYLKEKLNKFIEACKSNIAASKRLMSDSATNAYSRNYYSNETALGVIANKIEEDKQKEKIAQYEASYSTWKAKSEQFEREQERNVSCAQSDIKMIDVYDSEIRRGIWGVGDTKNIFDRLSIIDVNITGPGEKQYVLGCLTITAPEEVKISDSLFYIDGGLKIIIKNSNGVEVGEAYYVPDYKGFVGTQRIEFVGKLNKKYDSSEKYSCEVVPVSLWYTEKAVISKIESLYEIDKKYTIRRS